MAYTMRKAGEKMEWMQRINRVMDYVEDHLRDDVDAVSYTHLDVYKRQAQ